MLKEKTFFLGSFVCSGSCSVLGREQHRFFVVRTVELILQTVGCISHAVLNEIRAGGYTRARSSVAHVVSMRELIFPLICGVCGPVYRVLLVAGFISLHVITRSKFTFIFFSICGALF